MIGAGNGFCECIDTRSTVLGGMRHVVKSILGSWCGWSAAFCLKSTYSFLGRLFLAVVGFLFLFLFFFLVELVVAVVRVVVLVVGTAL